MTGIVEIVRVDGGADAEYAALRRMLWDIDDAENLDEVNRLLSGAGRATGFLARVDDTPAGFVEVGLREYAEGAATSPVGYIEGWYVLPQFRRRGIGTRLVQAAEDWARSGGCTEMASDTSIDNETSIAAHAGLGYREVERIVCFLKKLEGC
jgi:aminoglycoside 6'-N-acetyltransferase I